MYFCFSIFKTENIRYSGAYAAMGVDNSLRLEEFRNNFKVDVKKLTVDDMEFDMIGIDAALANAFRRILIAEVPVDSLPHFCFYFLRISCSFLYS